MQFASLKPLSLAVTLALTALPAVLTSTSVQAQSAAQFEFTLSATSLASSLNQIAAKSGVTIVYSAQLVSNKQSAPVTGSLTVAQAIQLALKGTGLYAKQQAGGGFAITTQKTAQKPTQQTNVLAKTRVSSSQYKSGSADDGYISDGVTTIGIWKNRDLQNTPYSINVVSNDFLKNIQAVNTDQMFKLNPVTQLNWSQAQNDTPYIFMRGFTSGTSSRNGLVRDGYDHGVSMIDVERVEVLTGLSGFLYGAGNVGGMVNYVTKRPTDERLNSLTVGNVSGENFYAHGDFGGQFDEQGRFGYRVNVYTQNGETAVEKQEAERDFVSVALDFNVTDNLLLQVDASTRDYHLEGRQAYWYGSKETRPAAKDIDDTKLWGQPWSVQDTQTDRLGANLHWDISDTSRLRIAYLDEKVERYATLTRNFFNGDGTFDQESRSNINAPHTMKTKSMFAYFDFDLTLAGIEHAFTIGARHSDNSQERYQDGWSQKHKIAGLSLSQPVYIDEPQWEQHGTTPYYLWEWGVTNFTLGDDVTFNDQWSALVGLTYSKISDESTYGGEKDPFETYKESGVTPSVSVLYKPVENVTTYATYMEALESGSIVWDDVYYDVNDNEYTVINYGEKMDILKSHQVELGAKAQLDGLLVTAALFEIDKPLDFYKILNESEAKFVQDGRQVHRGLELTLTGKATDNLTLTGGLTLLDAKIKEQKESPELEGNQPKEVADTLFKLYGEYQVQAIEGLSLNAALSYTSDVYADDENSEKFDAYSIFDLGARYEMSVANIPLALRLNVTNLTDEAYWANANALGAGRRVSLSMSFNF